MRNTKPNAFGVLRIKKKKQPQGGEIHRVDEGGRRRAVCAFISVVGFFLCALSHGYNVVEPRGPRARPAASLFFFTTPRRPLRFIFITNYVATTNRFDHSAALCRFFSRQQTSLARRRNAKKADPDARTCVTRGFA